MCRAVDAMNSMGYGRNDRIAVALPNGPEMASAFLSIASAFACVPLNPRMTRPEFVQYLGDCGVKAIVLLPGEALPASEAARSLDIPIIDLIPDSGSAGLFTLCGKAIPGATESGFASEEDIALVLHTSGTTSRPKLVPLTHRNICYSANKTMETLGLTQGDRCLNVMPLFYIHGLVGALLSSMAAGGSVVCTPGFISSEFMGWLDEFRPTWYTAVPAIHQKVLDCALRSGNPPAGVLRLIRSAAAPLPGSVMSGLESAFRAIVLEGYGMTEAYQITSNPLPPGKRKPGSVGIPTGSDIAVIDADGNFLSNGVAGEILVSGPNVMKGYGNDPRDNAETFMDGWFRTGDLGYMDNERYLFITGRIKEMINRGGEKVSPYEVEEALLSHPAVLESVVFPIADQDMGEEVGAAVVLKEGVSATPGSIRSFAAERLSLFKIPSRIFIVNELPRTPTGKTRRMGMAELLGLSGERNVHETPLKAAPMTPTEAEVARIWSEVLHQGCVGVLDNFLELGGDSLLATQVTSRISETFKVDIPITSVIIAENLMALAADIERRGLRPDSGGK